MIPSREKKHAVTYVGALNKLKGFHVLAKSWKKVLSKVPDAELYVIGSGSLGSNEKLGKYGLANARYERRFIQYLQDSNGNILSSVHFLGIKGGEEKEDLMRSSKVGIANPSGVGETFCIVAIEFEAVGTPVVSVRKNGLLDTVQNGRNGLLVKNGSDLAGAIVQLLLNDDLCDKMGRFGYFSSRKLFDIETIVKQWRSLLDDVYNNIPNRVVYEMNNPFNQCKWLREINRRFQKTTIGKRSPSILKYETAIRDLIRKM